MTWTSSELSMKEVMQTGRLFRTNNELTAVVLTDRL